MLFLIISISFLVFIAPFGVESSGNTGDTLDFLLSQPKIRRMFDERQRKKEEMDAKIAEVKEADKSGKSEIVISELADEIAKLAVEAEVKITPESLTDDGMAKRLADVLHKAYESSLKQPMGSGSGKQTKDQKAVAAAMNRGNKGFSIREPGGGSSK